MNISTKEGIWIIKSQGEKIHQNEYDFFVNTVKRNGGGTHGAKSYYFENSNQFVSFIYYFIKDSDNIDKLLTNFKTASGGKI